MPAKSVVRMGTNGSYLRKTVTTFVPCTVDAFGGDPAYGLPKTCQYAVIPDQPAVQPPGSTVGTVTSIVIKGGIVSSCLQIGELEVYSSGVNVALASQGAQVSASPSYSAEASADKAIDGIRPSAYPNVYHSQCGAGDYLRVDFAVPMKVDSIVLYGRTDYPSRDVYSYTLYSGATAVSQGQIDARSGSGSASPQ